MVKREHTAIDLTADEDGGEPVSQRVKVEEPNHLLCPITHEMFRDPVMLIESEHTYERAAIERHLGIKRADPITNVRIKSTALITNRGMRNAVQAWLDENPGINPEMLPPQPRRRRRQHHRRDLEVLREWRESCPELRDLWREDDPGHWVGVTWSDGRVTNLKLGAKRLSGHLPRLEGLTSLRQVWLAGNKLTGSIPEKLFEGLTSLQVVNLGYNQLTGSISEKLFEGLTTLEGVYLDNNQLPGPMPEKLFEGLTSLQAARHAVQTSLKAAQDAVLRTLRLRSRV